MSGKIRLENEVCYAGHNIKGKFHCEINNQQIRGIKIKLIGKESTAWSESHTVNRGGKSETETVHYSDFNEIINQDFIISTGGDVMPGWYEYDFSFRLPDVLPSSYDGFYGHIRYSVVGIVDRINKLDDKNKKNFVVLNPIDLNRISSHLHNPLTIADDKTICCLCCNRGFMTLQVDMPKQAFAVGEMAMVKVRLLNNSTVTPKNISVKLVQVLIARVRGAVSTKTEHKTIARGGVQIEGSAKGESVHDIQILIPDNMVIYNFTGSKLWEVAYKFQVTCTLPGWHTNLKIMVPTILGYIQYAQHPVSVEGSNVLIESPSQFHGQAPPPYSTLPGYSSAPSAPLETKK